VTASNFTVAQARAITAQQSVAISAGAGSGKTRVLAERIVRLLEDGVQPGQVVAATFTEPAAAELRERVTEYVEGRVKTEGGSWGQVMDALPLMQVGTIHSLCGRVAREHPVESGAGLGFRVLDPAETAEWLDEHLSPVLAELSAETLLAVPGKIRADVVRKLLDDPTTASAALEVSVRQARLDTGERARLAWQAVAGQWDAALTLLAGASGPSGDALERARQGVLAAGPAPVMGSALLSVRAVLSGVDGRSGKGWTADAKRTVHAALKEVRSLADRDDLLGEATEATQAHDAAVLALAEIFAHVRTRFGELKAEQEVATFADLETCADLALGFPHVRAYYAGRWTHLLIDEAQDTNPVQWRILSALAGEGVNLTVVGDEKQGIYAFRRADVGVFRTAQKEVEARGGEVIGMDTSFRTHAGLVDTVNAFFGSLMKGPDAARPTAARFEPLRAHRASHLDGEDAPSAELHVLLGESAGVLRSAEAAYLAGRVQALLLGGTLVHDREENRLRLLRLSDIALLFRTRTNLKAYEDAFSRAGLPYMVRGGRGLYDRPEVMDAANLLQAVSDPSEDVTLAAVLRGPHVHLQDEGLLQVAAGRQPGESLWDAARRSGDTQVRAAVALLTDLRERSVTLSASALLMEADARTGAALVHAAQPDGARRMENVRLFQGLIRRWAQEGRRDVVSVADHLRRLARQEAQAPEAVSPHPDAVQMMTIHASKGLEFGVVIVTDALRQGGGRPPKVRFDERLGVALDLPLQEGKSADWEALGKLEREREQSESERVTYVAFTRAADLLILSVISETGAKAMERYEAYVAHLPEAGVERHYLSPEDVPDLVPLTLNVSRARPTLDVKSGPGVILPGSLPVTSLATFLQCPRMFAYRHLEGRLPLVSLWSDHAAAQASNPEGRAAGRQIGDAVHRALEHHWDPAEMKKQFPYFAASDFQTVVNLVASMEKPVFASVRDRPYQRERAIQVPVGPIVFEGVVDAHDAESGMVLDYKTDRHVEPEHHLPQLSLYAHHLQAQEAALAYLRHDRLHLFSAEVLRQGFTQVEAAVARMVALEFAPQPSLQACGRCAFRGVCDAAEVTA
jgi:ATP-dependent helicase/nuclease subunit A